MALRDQPYLPLYVQDFMTDEKLIECSAQSTGVYIRIMCVFHKNDPYGTILLKQKDKQTSEQIKNFAIKLARHLPYDISIIESSLRELIEERVLRVDGDKLYQKRMVKDDYISCERSKAGSKGGKFAQAKVKAKVQANSENEIVIEYENNKKGIPSEFELLSYDEIKNVLFGEQSWLEQIQMNLSLNQNQVMMYLDAFLNNQKVSQPGKRTLTDVRNHFNNWMNIKSSKGELKPSKKKVLTLEDLKRRDDEARKNWRPPTD